MVFVYSDRDLTFAVSEFRCRFWGHLSLRFTARCDAARLIDIPRHDWNCVSWRIEALPDVDTGWPNANAGDYFHELAGVRHVLSLLDHDSELTVLSVEGLRPEDVAGQSDRNWDGVDCGLYYGTPGIKDCNRIEIEQLKYSSAVVLAASS